MTIKVMLVDDSAIVRGLLTRALAGTSDIQIVATANNGINAITMAREYQPDIIVLDVEMPEMDGITALPQLLKVAPRAKIIMASTLTSRNASISLKALGLGASDYIAKPSAGTPEERDAFYSELHNKVLALAETGKMQKSAAAAQPSLSPAKTLPDVSALKSPSFPVKALAIAASTGGPQALMTLFANMKGKLRGVPVFLTQHMPATFTTAFAEHLSRAGDRPCTEAKDGEEVKAGHIYLAPGNFHMIGAQENGKIIIRLNQEPLVNFCRPAADPMIQSLSAIYGRHLLVAVMTGMGQDGLEGAKTAVAGGGSVIAQDEATSAVWGMPKAVATNHLCSAVLPLADMAGYLVRNIGG